MDQTARAAALKVNSESAQRVKDWRDAAAVSRNTALDSEAQPQPVDGVTSNAGGGDRGHYQHYKEEKLRGQNYELAQSIPRWRVNKF